jgi:integrase
LTPEQISQELFHLGDGDRLIVRMFLVLGLRTGAAIVDGMEIETRIEGSEAAVWLPVWRSAGKNALPDSFIFPSSRGTAINTNNFLFRVLKEAGKKAQIKGVTHQMLYRTRSIYMAQLMT